MRQCRQATATINTDAEKSFMTRDQVRELALQAKHAQRVSWAQLAEQIGRSPVYAAMLVYGYGQTDDAEAAALVRALSLPETALEVLTQPPYRTPAHSWPPTDPFVYRFYEAVMLYGPVFKDVAHEMFGDGIMSAIDMSVDIRRLDDAAGARRMAITLTGKWLEYKKF